MATAKKTATKPTPAPAAEKATTGHEFEFDTQPKKEGDEVVTKKFKTIVPFVIIPGLNNGEPMTALEVASDYAAQLYLVENQCSGVIEEVL